jgi:hypothetical protein
LLLFIQAQSQNPKIKMHFINAILALSAVTMTAATPLAARKPTNEIRAILLNPETLETRDVMVDRYTLKTRMVDSAITEIVKRECGNGGECPEADDCLCGGRKFSHTRAQSSHFTRSR